MKFIPSSDEEFFQALITEAPFAQGLHSNTEKWEDIPWLDKKLLAETASFRERYSILLAASSAIVIGLGIQLKTTSVPFIQTSTLSEDLEKTILRTVKHASHFIKWFTLGSQDQDVYNDLQKIKKTHAHLAKNMRPYAPSLEFDAKTKADLEKWQMAVAADFSDYTENNFAKINRYDPEIKLNQFDMVIIQLDFVVPYILPEIHGIVGQPVEFRGFFHHWAIIFRLLGVEDRFNLALHPSKDLIYRILKNLFAEFRTMDLRQCRLCQAYLESSNKYLKFPLSPTAFLVLITSAIHPDLQNGKPFNATQMNKLMSVRDKVTLNILKTGLQILKWSNWVKSAFVYLSPKLYNLVSAEYHKLGIKMYAENYAKLT